MKWKWKNWNDQLSIFIIFIVPAMWILSAFHPLNEQAMGASILAWGMVIQFYFRRAPMPDGEK